MVAGGAQPEKPRVEHMTEPRHGMPVRVLEGSEGPREVHDAEAIEEAPIADEIRIVVRDEAETEHVPVGDRRHRDEGNQGEKTQSGTHARNSGRSITSTMAA